MQRCRASRANDLLRKPLNPIRTTALAGLLGLLGSLGAPAQEIESYEHEPINYSAAQPHDAIQRLAARIAAGAVKLGQTDRQVAEALLRELHIPIESQLLVFSKTSLQRGRISPDRPRSLFFNDTCYVGWVPGGLIEVIGVDPVIGPVFYSLDPKTVVTNASGCFARDKDCLRCHGGTFVRGIPGVFARSVFPNDEGELLLRHGWDLVDFTTPFTNRWGGWYVTGLHGTALHRGNVVAAEKAEQLSVDFRRGANITNLSSFFDTTRYLADSSDIVALLVFEQQIAIQNVLTKASLDCRRMLDYQKKLQRALKDPPCEEPAYDSVKSVFESTARDLTDALLFRGEAQLPEGLKGSPSFQRAFLAGAIRTTDGLSLKDFDLKGHLFKNRCSYLIYSESFHSLPEPLKKRVYVRLAHALGPSAPDPRYAYLDANERARILKILLETDPRLASALDSNNVSAASATGQ
jgi:hypothetical protein